MIYYLFFRCQLYKKKKCRAGGYISYTDFETKTLSPIINISDNPNRRHNHGPKEHNLEKISQQQRVYARAEEMTDKTMKHRFNDEVRNDPNASDILWKKSQSAMYKRSMKMKPPTPKNIEEIHEGLTDPKYPELGKHYKRKVITLIRIIYRKQSGDIFQYLWKAKW